MIFATYTATVDAAAGEPEYNARVQLVNAPEDYDATVGNAAAEAILTQPRLALASAGDTIPLIAGRMRWLHDGVDPATGEAWQVTVSADLLGCAREWKWPLAASRGSTRGGDLTPNPLGYEIDRGGPPPGQAAFIDLELDLFDFATATTVTSKLINGGQVRGSSRVSDNDQHAMELSGAGFADRYARIEITLDLPLDHGLTHGEIAVLACQLAGVPGENILIDPDLGEPRTRAVKLSCTPLWEVLKDVLAPIGYRPNDSRDPRGIDAFSVEVDRAGPVVATLTAADLSADGFSADADASVAQCVRVTGTDPEQREVPLEGTVTTETVTETYTENYVWRRAVAVQDAAGSVSALSPGGDVTVPGLTLTERVVLRQTYKDGCLVRARTTRESFRLIEKVRYTTSASADGMPYGYFVCYFFDGTPVKDDSADAYRLQEERFVVTSEQIVDIVRNAVGQTTNEITRVSEFGWPEAAIKSRATVGTAWESTNYGVVNIQGSGAAREIEHETWFAGPERPDTNPATYSVGDLLPPPPGVLNPVVQKYLAQEELERIANGCGEETGTEESTYDLGLKYGLTQLYADGAQSVWSEERGRLSETTKVTRVQETPASHTRITSGTAPDGRAGRIGPKKLVVERGVAGSLPNLPQCSAETQDGGGRAFSATACTERVREGAEENPVLSAGSVQELSSPFVESEAEARRWAEIELEIEAGIRAELSLSYASPIYDIGKTIIFDLPDRGFSAQRAVIENTEADIGGDGKLIEKLTVRFSLLE